MKSAELKHVVVSATEFPPLKNEDWRYTEVAKLVGTYLVPTAPKKSVASEGHNLTFVDGFLVSQRLPRGVNFQNRTLSVEEGVTSSSPVTIYYRGKTKSAAWEKKLNLELGSGARLILREHFSLAPESFAKTKLSVRTASQAHLAHSIVVIGDASARLISHHAAELETASHYQLQLASTGLKFVRHELDVRLNGEGAQADLRGVQLVRGEKSDDQDHSSQIGTHVSVDHRAPTTRSTQVFRGVVRGVASNICHSKVFIRDSATQAQSDQSLKTILLDPDSKGFARPELHVANDQVQCRHGSAVGPLSRESLFYLKSRGLTDELARQTLVRAFVSADLVLADELFGNLEEVLA